MFSSSLDPALAVHLILFDCGIHSTIIYTIFYGLSTCMLLAHFFVADSSFLYVSSCPSHDFVILS